MPTVLPDEISRHACIDCRAEISGDLSGLGPRKPRAIVTVEGEPKRCATHCRVFAQRQRKLARARSIERKYEITAEDAHELYLFQEGRCWLCQKATGATKSLAVDHDHATEEVRGRLCGPCNQFIGRLSDSPEAATRLVKYLTGDTPYRRLKAAQTLSAYNFGGSLKVEVAQVIDIGGELFADWRFDQANNWNRWLVRRLDGVWSTERVTSEPIVTNAECPTCHAKPGQPHTEFCRG